MLKAAVSGGGPAVVNSRRRWCSSKVVKPAAVESSWQREQCFARLPEEYWFRKQEFAIMENVVTEEEAGVLLKDMERALKRRRYEKDHWDAVIVNFREVRSFFVLPFIYSPCASNPCKNASHYPFFF